MKTIGIYYFSGTGNTAMVAEMLNKAFKALGRSVTLMPIDEMLHEKKAVQQEAFDLIGIGAPVMGFGVPAIVMDFIRWLPTVNDQKLFIFRTAGGVAPINYGASAEMIRQLEKKGYRCFHERLFSLGSNWVKPFDDSVVQALYQATKRKVQIMCAELLSDQPRRLRNQTPLKARLLTRMLRPLAPALFKLSGKDLKADPSCTLCGHCAKNCPVGNVELTKKGLTFKWRCNACMRCVYECPKKALHHGLFAFFDIPEGYNLQQKLNKTLESERLEAMARPPFFEAYVSQDDL